MKKTNLTKAILLLLCLCLVTSSFVGSTLAKYVTTANASDTARVAKFGVTVSTTGSLFDKYYVDAAGGNTPGSTNMTVHSYNDSDTLVAPGTQNDTGMTFTVTGTPEVSVNVAFAVTVTDDVFLKSITAPGGYLDYTTGNSTTDTFAVASDYYPVVFTLKNGAGTTLASGNLTAIKTYLEGLNKTVAPNTNLASSSLGTNIDGTYKLTRDWEFSADAAQDKKDTLLGNLQADSTLAAKTTDGSAFTTLSSGLTNDYDLLEDVAISVTVTQVD